MYDCVTTSVPKHIIYTRSGWWSFRGCKWSTYLASPSLRRKRKENLLLEGWTTYGVKIKNKTTFYGSLYTIGSAWLYLSWYWEQNKRLPSLQYILKIRFSNIKIFSTHHEALWSTKIRKYTYILGKILNNYKISLIKFWEWTIQTLPFN